MILAGRLLAATSFTTLLHEFPLNDECVYSLQSPSSDLMLRRSKLKADRGLKVVFPERRWSILDIIIRQSCDKPPISSDRYVEFKETLSLPGARGIEYRSYNSGLSQGGAWSDKVQAKRISF